jgi:NitT/TauT family transport system substrate-binding protein
VRSWKLIAALAAAVLTLTACSTAPAPETGGLITLHVGVSAGASSSAPMYFAVEHGVFRNLGLDVQLEPVNDATVVVPRLVSGQTQFSMGSFGPFTSAVEKDLPIRMVAGATRMFEGENQYSALIVASTSTATDMSGMTTLAVSEAQRNPLDQMAINALHGDYAAMNLLTVPLGSLGDLVGSGSAQAGRLFQPFLGQALAKGNVKVLRWIAPPLSPAGVPAAIFMGSRTFLDSQPDVGRRFVQGVEQANAYARAHLPEIAAYAPRTGLTQNPLKVEYLPDYEPGPVVPAKVDQLLGLYESGGYLQKKLTAADVIWTPPAH